MLVQHDALHVQEWRAAKVMTTHICTYALVPEQRLAPGHGAPGGCVRSGLSAMVAITMSMTWVGHMFFFKRDIRWTYAASDLKQKSA